MAKWSDGNQNTGINKVIFYGEVVILCRLKEWVVKEKAGTEEGAIALFLDENI